MPTTGSALRQLVFLLILFKHSQAKFDLENITVYDFPDEDTCDYDIYLWEVINSDSHWENKIDYYKLFDIVPKSTPLREIKESYLNLLSFWESWCTLCNIRPHDKEKGERIIHKGYQTITNPRKRDAYDKERDVQKEVSTVSFKRIREWVTTIGVVLVLVAIIFTTRRLRYQRNRLHQNTIKAISRSRGGSNIHILRR